MGVITPWRGVTVPIFPFITLPLPYHKCFGHLEVAVDSILGLRFTLCLALFKTLHSLGICFHFLEEQIIQRAERA